MGKDSHLGDGFLHIRLEIKTMKVHELIELWEGPAAAKISAREFTLRLPLYDAARILALTEMYPAKTETQIITELLSAALDELEEAFPYAKGEKVIAEDECKDPIYEDIGPTPSFLRKSKEYARRLELEAQESPRSQLCQE